MTDTPLDLDAIEARADAATDGPWLASHNLTDDTHDVSVLYSNGIGVLVADFHKRPDDARFAAHARTDVPALIAALRKAEAQVAHLRGQSRESNGWREMRDRRDADTARAEKAEAQVAAVLALCDEAAPRRMGDGYLSASVLAPEDVRAAVDGAGDVPMSPNTGHDLRERIARRIDQAWAEAADAFAQQNVRDQYDVGYLDGLEHAEGIARSTPLTDIPGGAS
mgnify:CR=1 FL=1